jgi:general secretion pathway protein E
VTESQLRAPSTAVREHRVPERSYENGAAAAAALEPAKLPPGVSREFLLHHRICPIHFTADGAVGVAIEPASLLEGVDDLSVAYGRAVVVQQQSAEDVQMLIARVTSEGEAQFDLPRQESPDDTLASDIRDLANQPPVVRYVNLLLHDAYEANASDVHLESTKSGLRARYRIDGVLLAASDPPAHLERAVVSRIKLLADLDIAERRRPQDGRIRLRLDGRDLDIRASTVPSMLGESVVLRLLERGGLGVALSDLGMPPTMLAAVERLARKPHGMILATGPTGSGKTTTLHAALRLRDAGREKIITLEDPVEYALEGVTQVPVHRQTGVTFPSMLRSILRQDPDVLMVGEMRDGETAELVVQAALTGHLVFSTLHTNDALGAIPRLTDLGIPPYLVAATLDAVLAQRLVRRCCTACLEPYGPDLVVSGSGAELPAPFDTAAAVATPQRRGRGCELCRGTGYRGRIGLYELLVLTPELRNAIASSASAAVIEELALHAGLVRLQADGWSKVAAGITTIEEVLRVTQSET